MIETKKIIPTNKREKYGSYISIVFYVLKQKKNDMKEKKTELLFVKQINIQTT